MNIVGIIAEYNPFHNGHLWHVNEARRLASADYVVAVMSGSFLQRGEPAIFDKWSRAEMAVRGGIDLVIELPVVYAVRSAQYFATGGIRLLNQLGATHVCFGAENADRELLQKAALTIDNPVTTETLRDNLKIGLPYAAALAKTIHLDSGLSPTLLSSPNNILAIEYLRALAKWAPTLIPIPVKRKQAHYHDSLITGSIASATAIRNSLRNGDTSFPEVAGAVPTTTFDMIKTLYETGYGPIEMDHFSEMILYKLRTSLPEDLEQLAEMGEGLHNKFLSAAFQAGDIAELLALVKSKRYLQTRLQRISLYALLNITNTHIKAFDSLGPLYARVLAFNNRGREIIRSVTNNESFAIITKTADFINSSQLNNFLSLSDAQKMLALDIKASDIYTLASPMKHLRVGRLDFRRSPVYIRS